LIGKESLSPAGTQPEIFTGGGGGASG